MHPMHSRCNLVCCVCSLMRQLLTRLEIRGNLKLWHFSQNGRKEMSVAAVYVRFKMIPHWLLFLLLQHSMILPEPQKVSESTPAEQPSLPTSKREIICSWIKLLHRSRWGCHLTVRVHAYWYLEVHLPEKVGVCITENVPHLLSCRHLGPLSYYS